MRVLVLIPAIILFGCSKPVGAPASLPSATSAATSYVEGSSGESGQQPSSQKSNANPLAAAAVPMLAYTYGFGIQAPSVRIRTLVAKQEAACTSAGIALCQVTGSKIEAAGKDDVNASLGLRAAPPWLNEFRGAIAEDAKSAGGRIYSATVASEDLSRDIVDEEAAVRAKTSLRDRLQAILESRPAKTADLVEIATALSQAQGELDATQSELAVAKTRVAMSEVKIEYHSAGVFAPEGTWSPLATAIDNLAGTLAGTLALMVMLFGALLPWAIAAGGVTWFVRSRLGKTKGRGR